MNPRKTFTVVVVLAGVVVSGAPPELRAEDLLTIARDGKTPYTIVHADPATEPEKKALQELSDFLGRVTGATFPATTESALAGNVRGIYVGWTKFAAQNGIETAKLGDEEWVIRTAGDNLIITGGRPRGLTVAQRDWRIGSGTVFYSREYLAILGYAEGEMAQTADAWVTRVHPDDLARAEAVAEMVSAKTEYAYSTARSNLLGRFSGEIAAVVAETFTDIHLQLRRNNAEKAANAVIECLN